MQRNIKRTVAKTLISIIILLVLLVGAGAAYVYFGGDYNPKPEQPKQEAESFKPIKPHQPNPNAPESAAVESLLTPVSAGSNTTLIVKTQPTSTCTIDVKYNNVPAKDSGLSAKTADDFGSVSWTWTVDKTAAIGTWPAKVTCAFHGKTAMVQGDLQVVK